MRVTRPIFVAALGLAVFAAGCGSSPPPAPQPISFKPENKQTRIVLGSRKSGKELLLADIYARAIREAGFRVRRVPGVGAARRALSKLRQGSIGAYPEDQTKAITTLFGLRPEEVPTDPENAYGATRDDFLAEGIRPYPPTKFSNSKTLAALAVWAEQLELDELSDLGDIRELTIAAPPECRRHVECLVAIDEGYELKLGRVLHVPPGQRYAVLDSRRADLSVVGSTDGQLATPSPYTALEDDNHKLPPGNLMLLVNKKVSRQAGPQLAALIKRVQDKLDRATIRRLNARVELRGAPPSRVAAEYLRHAGLID